MKKVEAIVRLLSLDDLLRALLELGIAGLTVSEVERDGRQASRGEPTGQAARPEEVHSEVKVELAVTDGMALRVLDVIEGMARTADRDDATVLVSTIDEAVRIRTGEHGDGAL
jgi:nitrogen regulatory protein P-II 1